MFTFIFLLAVIEEIDQDAGDIVLSCAIKQIGKPFVMGAAGPNAFDNSGLTQYCYKQAGKSLPHSTRQQCNMGANIPESGVRPGDLACAGDFRVGIWEKTGSYIMIEYVGDVVKRKSYSNMNYFNYRHL